MNEMLGKDEDRRSDTILSTPWSTSVTISTAVVWRETAGQRCSFSPLSLHRELLTVELCPRVDVSGIGGEHHGTGIVGHGDHLIVDGLQIEVSHGGG